MHNRFIRTFFVLTEFFFFAQASARMLAPFEIPEFDDPVPTEVRTTRSSPTPTKYALEKYPFSSDYKEAYRYRTNVPNARIVS